MNSFEKFDKIRNEADRRSDMITNVTEVSGASGFRCLHVLWLYPDVMNIHGGRGDMMAILHMANLLNLPVEIRRWDSLAQDIDWEWPHLIFMTAGELKCAADVIAALKRQMGSQIDGSGLAGFVARGGYFIANGSSGAVLAETIQLKDGQKQSVGQSAGQADGQSAGQSIQGLGLLKMTWTQRESVWGDDIWVKVPVKGPEAAAAAVGVAAGAGVAIAEGGVAELDVIGNQIAVADVELAEGQEPFGVLEYGRGNNGISSDKLGKGVSTMAGEGSGLEGARTDNVIYTGVLGPLLTKNPEFTASILAGAANVAGIEFDGKLKKEDIEIELKSAEYIKAFMRGKQE